MQFKIGQTVSRHDPGGHQTTFSIQSSRDVQYHTDLQARGYRYTDVSKPRVHAGSDSVCVACEG